MARKVRLVPGDLQLQAPQALFLLALLPVLLGATLVERRLRAVFRFSAAHVFGQHPRGLRPYLLPSLTLFRVVAVTWVVVAIARPQATAARQQDLSVEGIDIVIAFDLSSSMRAADFQPANRMEVARDVLLQFIDSRVNDRIGLVVFSGAAYTQSPLTFDYGALKNIVRTLRMGVIEDGTAIGDALAASLNRLRESDAKSRVLILMTDGDNNAGSVDPLDAAAMAKALKLPIFTILVGKGGKVPYPSDSVDIFGKPLHRLVELPVNPELLKKIASETGGQYYLATDRESLEGSLRKVLDAMEKSRLLEGGATASYEEHFHPFLLAAFLFVALELLLRVTVLRVFP